MSARGKNWLVFGVLWFCYTWVHQGPGWNQNSRLDLLHALWTQHSLAIDAYHENTGDKSVFGGHYYSDKAPGIVLLALPAFAVSAWLLEAYGLEVDSRLGWRVSDWVTTAGSVGILTALGGVAFLGFLRRLVGERVALLTTLAVFLGSAPFPYATMLFSHAAVMGLVCVALWAIADEVFLECVSKNAGWGQPAYNRQRYTGVSGGRVSSRGVRLGVQNTLLARVMPGSRGESGEGAPRARADDPGAWGAGWAWRYLLAGLCCGLAMAGEYPAALAAGGVLFLAWWVAWRRAFILALGALPPLFLVAVYQWACFGSPLGFGYAHLSNPAFAGMKEGFFGITFPPRLSALYLQWLSPERGLLLWSPFYAAAFLGLRPLARRSRVLCGTSVAVVVLHSAAMGGYYMPDGGAALGPRLLTPMLPFLGVVAAFGVRRFWLAGVFWGTLALLLTGLGTLIDAMPASQIKMPWLEFYLPRLLEGRLVSTLGEVMGLSAGLSVAVVAGVMAGAWVWACWPGRGEGPVERPSREPPASEGLAAC